MGANENTGLQLRLNEIRNDLSREIDTKMAELQRKFDMFSKELSREQQNHHKENRVRLQSIDHQARANGQIVQDAAHITSSLNTRLNLLFDEKGEGYFADLKKEVRSINNRITYAAGFLACTYLVIQFLIAHHKF